MLSDILARSRGPSGATYGTEGGKAPTDLPLHALQEGQFGEVILERMPGNVEEMLALVDTLEEWIHYLFGVELQVQT